MARRGRNILFPICFLVANFAVCAWAQQSSPSAAIVPRLIKFSGVVGDGEAQPGSGVIGITFALYAEAQGGAPLWMEVQNIQLDGKGHYTALLGASKAEGVPLELFGTNEARWLGVQPENQAEQPRVLLVSVPYALKAAEAESLGGKPASAYVLAPTGATPQAASSSKGSPAATCATPPCPVVTPGGTANFLAKFQDATTVQNSAIFESGGLVGIGNSNPTRTLDVNGEIRVGGGNIFMQRNLNDLAGRRNWAWGTETFNVGDVSLFVSTSNTAFPSVPVFTALSSGFMGVGVATPTANLEISGKGGGLLVDSPGAITVVNSSSTANSFTGSNSTAIVTGIQNGAGITNVGLPSPAPPAALLGQATATTNSVAGVTGTTVSPNGIGVVGVNLATTSASNAGSGVFGGTLAPGGSAVEAHAFSAANGIYAQSDSGTGGTFVGPIALETQGPSNFNGDVAVNANLSVSGTKNFRIDDPLDPAHKYLVHASIESSEVLNLYSGNVTLDKSGKATVQLPDWMEAENKDFRYALTCIGGFAPVYIAEEIKNNQFRIAGGRSGMKVSWQITTLRNDSYVRDHPMLVEQPK